MAVNAARGGIVRRREDPRLIQGQGRYTDDVHIDGCLHAVFVRSPLAHARMTGIDFAAARAQPGVAGVFGAADLTFESDTARPRLCSEEVNFVGDAIAVVVGETREAATDGAAAVLIDYEPLPVLVDPTAAMDNVAFDFDMGDPGALDGAEVVVRGRFVNQRLAAVPLEGNGVVAEPRPDG